MRARICGLGSARAYDESLCDLLQLHERELADRVVAKLESERRVDARIKHLAAQLVLLDELRAQRFCGTLHTVTLKRRTFAI